MNCVDCGELISPSYRKIGLNQCEECFEDYKSLLKTRLRDVETYNEPRIEFLIRMSKELGLGYTRAKMVRMIQAGMTDFMILDGIVPANSKTVSFFTR